MISRPACLALALVAIVGPLQAQQERVIEGRVVAAADSTPLAAVWVGVVGTRIATLTDSAGRFGLRAPTGDVKITIRRVGIGPDTTRVPAGRDSVTVLARVLAVRLDTVGVEAMVSPARARFDTLAQPSIITITQREITRAPGLLEPDIVRAVQLLPGTVARNDYSIGYNVRGGESDQNLVLLDGVTVFNPSHLGGLFSTFDANAVDRADFLTGGFPAGYSGRLSSVLDVTLRPGNRDRVHGKGAVSLLSSKTLVEGPLGPASFLLSARRTYADQVVKAFTSEILPYYFTDLMGKADLRYRGGGELSITGYWGRDVLGLNLVKATTDRPAIDLDYDWGNRLLGVTWRQPAGRVALEQRVGASEFSTTLGLVPGLAQFTNRARLLSALSALTLAPGDGHSLRGGVAVEAYDMPYHIATPALGNAFSFDRRYRPTVWAAFADDQWRPAATLLVRGGLRAERVPGARYANLSPRAAVKLFLSPDQAVTGSVGRYYQVPQSLRDQELPISIYEFWVGADGRIPVARSDHLVLGYERWMGGTQVSVEAYGKSFRNLIAPNRGIALRDPGDEFLPVEGSAWGADLLIRRHVGRVRGWLAYGYVRAIRRSLGLEYPPAHDRRHTINLVLEAPGPLGSELGVRWGFGSPLPYTGFIGEWRHREFDPAHGGFLGGEWEPIGGPTNAARYPPYSRLDVGLHWRARRWGILWEPYLQVVNAYNRRNVFAYSYDYVARPPTRTAIFQLPFLATFGLEFSW